MMLNTINNFLEHFESSLSLLSLKEDCRKIGINFTTAGAIALFISNKANFSFWLLLGSIWLIFIGTLFIIFGLKKDKSC